MIEEYMYIELKSGYADDGPAWIGRVKKSKSGRTLYFNNHAFLRFNGGYANFYDVENGDKYWISGMKKDMCNRHWAGHGKIVIDKRIVSEYLKLAQSESLNPNDFESADIADVFPVERITKYLNEKKE